ncbi:phage late control D family protein [Aquisalimonas asiatica]|uniref:Uncharacterized conserved protein, implicated in type VI secretion and phage assembly n=1 Tax=Aquisalimonas asiatica TaxID=406100 RepID=A0A1H8V3A4_9GAMM|nr:phage late control D family protein [Aquisalimonas asiatica]SEP09972.1 Uncharacterized conserved protein, implicated in type VI secretion and phage assembly [Aquisalimonas asiatica]
MNRLGKQALPEASLALNGREYRVTILDVREWVSRPFRCWAYVALDEHTDAPDPDAVVGREAVLRWSNGDWGERHRGGLVTSLRGGDCPDTGRRYFEVVVEPRLASLRNGEDTCLFTRVNVDAFVQERLSGVGYGPPHELVWRATGVPYRRLLLQAQESEFELLQRTLARAGVCYAWDDGPAEQVRFVDDSRDLPLREEVISLSPELTPVAPFGEHGFNRYRIGKRLVPDPPPLVHERLWEDGGTVARVRQQRAEAERYLFRAWGPQADLRAGLRIKVQGLSRSGDALDPAEMGLQLITYAHHRLSIETDDQGARKKVSVVRGGYEVYVEGVPDSIVYRPPEPRVRPRPMVMSAKTASQSPDRPDALRNGGVRAQVADHGDHDQPLARMTPYNSGGRRKPGWYTPLTAGNRVLVSCLDHDPDMPVVMGVISTARNRHIAAASAGRHGGYVTNAGQGLRIEGAGRQQAEDSRVMLHTVNGDGVFEISSAGERIERDLIRLATERGLLELESGGDQAERAGHRRSDTVGSSERMTIGDGFRLRGESDVHVRSASALRMVGREGVNLASAARLQMTASRAIRVEGGDGARVRLNGGNGVWRTLGGAATLQGARAISLTSRNGKVTLRNAAGTAAVAVHSDGRVRFQGERIQVSASGAVNFSGDMDYRAGATVQEPSISLIPGEPTPLPKVTGGGAARIHALDWPRWMEPEQTVPVSFTAERFEDGDIATVKLYRADGSGRRIGEPIAEESVTLAAGRTLYQTELTIPSGGGGCCDPGAASAGLRFDVEAEGTRSLSLSEVATIRQGVWFRFEDVPGVDPGILKGWLRQMPQDDDETGEPGPWHDTTVAADGLLRFPPMDSGRPMELRLAYRVDPERHGGTEWIDAGIYALVGDDLDAEHRVTPGTPCVFQIDGPLAEPLTIRCLPPPVMVNLRPDPDNAPEPEYRLTDEQLDYFKALGNAVLFIHGYQVDQGTLPDVIRGASLEQISLTTYRWEAETDSLLRRGSALDEELMEANWPRLSYQPWGLRDYVLEPRLDAAAELNGTGAWRWLLSMEHNLNRAAGLDDGDTDEWRWDRYTRCVGVTWSGDHGATAFKDSEVNAVTAGRRLVPLIRQLHQAGLGISLVTHSLGARVALSALNILAQAGEEGIVGNVVLWQAAVAQTALLPDPDQARPHGGDTQGEPDEAPLRDVLGTANFPLAYKAAERTLVLHTNQDNILGDHDDGSAWHAWTEGEHAELLGGAVGGWYRNREVWLSMERALEPILRPLLGDLYRPVQLNPWPEETQRQYARRVERFVETMPVREAWKRVRDAMIREMDRIEQRYSRGGPLLVEYDLLEPISMDGELLSRSNPQHVARLKRYMDGLFLCWLARFNRLDSHALGHHMIDTSLLDDVIQGQLSTRSLLRGVGRVVGTVVASVGLGIMSWYRSVPKSMPALGYARPYRTGGVDALEQEGRLWFVDQEDLLRTHSGMRVPEGLHSRERDGNTLFERIYQEEIVEGSLMRSMAFGKWTREE